MFIYVSLLDKIVVGSALFDCLHLFVRDHQPNLDSGCSTMAATSHGYIYGICIKCVGGTSEVLCFLLGMKI